MSSLPRDAARKRVTLTKLAEMRALGEPIVMVTAYDHPGAKVAEAAGVDIVLVGDSAANNVLGYADTVPVTVEELLDEARAHAERRQLEDQQRVRVDEVGVPTYELHRLPDGIDLGSLYELALDLRDQGMA